MTHTQTNREQPWAPSWEAFQKMQKEPKPIVKKEKPILRLWDQDDEPEVVLLRVK